MITAVGARVIRFTSYMGEVVLLAGETSSELANTCGRLLGGLHAGTWRDGSVAARLDDRSYFDQLRMDPYYRQIARGRRSLAERHEGVRCLCPQWRSKWLRAAGVEAV